MKKRTYYLNKREASRAREWDGLRYGATDLERPAARVEAGRGGDGGDGVVNGRGGVGGGDGVVDGRGGCRAGEAAMEADADLRRRRLPSNGGGEGLPSDEGGDFRWGRRW
uniref:DUF834 domain-containing protein n=1 Tax=Oryza brachyantha TaxID=4533 RepID=J3N834_ORYBR